MHYHTPTITDPSNTELAQLLQHKLDNKTKPLGSFRTNRDAGFTSWNDTGYGISQIE